MTLDDFVKELVRTLPDNNPNQTQFIVNTATELLLRHGDKLTPDDCVDRAKRLAYGLQIRVLKKRKTTMTSTFLQKLTDTTRRMPIQLNIGGTDIDFEIRIPLKAESEKARALYTSPDENAVESEYARIRNPLIDSVAELEGERRAEVLGALQVIETEDDLFIKGTSVRVVAKSNVGNRMKAEWLFSLINDPELEKPHSYDELAELMPESVIRAITQAIEEAIQPNYEVARKKS